MFTLADIVPWGRSYDEYCRMFALTPNDLRSRILGCADGPASFNAEATRRGSSVTSCDPLYRFDVDAIRERIRQTRDQVLDQTRRNRHEFVWTTIASVDDLARLRMSAMEDFLRDFDNGRSEGRYVDAELPSLPFGDQTFDLALCSHFLFLYSSMLGGDFHTRAILELQRVATEVRIFPLLDLGGGRSPFLDDAIDLLRAHGVRADIQTVGYEFRRGGNEMLRIRHQ